MAVQTTTAARFVEKHRLKGTQLRRVDRPDDRVVVGLPLIAKFPVDCWFLTAAHNMLQDKEASDAGLGRLGVQKQRPRKLLGDLALNAG
jgi:hypothetical protein